MLACLFCPLAWTQPALFVHVARYVRAAIALWGNGRVAGTSERVGTIVKVAEEGFWNQTWEIEIVSGGVLAENEGFASEPFYATVRDPDLLPLVQQYFDSQEEVQIQFTDDLLWDSACNGEREEREERCASLTSIELSRHD